MDYLWDSEGNLILGDDVVKKLCKEGRVCLIKGHIYPGQKSIYPKPARKCHVCGRPEEEEE